MSAVVGTHTHVATADGHVLPGGTAYQTDVGMTGPHSGVIGMDKAAILRRFLDGQPARFEVAAGDTQMNTVLIDVDETTGQPVESSDCAFGPTEANPSCTVHGERSR